MLCSGAFSTASAAMSLTTFPMQWRRRFSFCATTHLTSSFGPTTAVVWSRKSGLNMMRGVVQEDAGHRDNTIEATSGRCAEKNCGGSLLARGLLGGLHQMMYPKMRCTPTRMGRRHFVVDAGVQAVVFGSVKGPTSMLARYHRVARPTTEPN